MCDTVTVREQTDRTTLQVANGSRINAFYSTPACYAHAIHSARPAGWPEKTDDFLSYAQNAGDFWTGFYSSRPALKRYERILSAFLIVRYY